MAPPDPQKRIRTLIGRKRKVEADLAAAVGQLALANPAAPAGQQVDVPAGATVTADVDTRNVTISLALNGTVLPHPGTPRFSVDLAPLQPGDNVLLIAPFAIDANWAFEVLVLADGAQAARVADQGTDVGVRPSVDLHLVVS